MKKILLLSLTIFSVAELHAQSCTPVNCSANLPAYGGVCDTLLIDGVVNQPYSDFESFVLTPNCFDAGLINPSSSGTQVKILNIDGFTYSGFPAGVSGQTNQSSYSPTGSGNTLGCIGVSGTPNAIGVFNCTMDFLADVQICSDFPLPPLPDNPASYVLWLKIKPVPTFTGLSTSYCVSDGAVNMTVTGTPGGTFSGPGVSGNTFDPVVAGPGMHEIIYKVSRQDAGAVAPAADSMIVVVNVYNSGTTFYADSDGDGFGDPNSTALGCTPPNGYVGNSLDCNDADLNITIGDTYYQDADADGYGNDTITTAACNAPAGYVNNNEDCNDSNNQIYPGATDISNNTIDENCDGVDGYLGLSDFKSDYIKIHPNPTSNNFTIDLKTIQILSVDITDLNGRVVYSNNINNTNTVINVSSIMGGLYLIKIQTVNGTLQESLLVTK